MLIIHLTHNDYSNKRPASEQEQRKVTAQKPLHPLIISNFTPFHEPKNRRPNISLTEIMENQQKLGTKSGSD